MTRAHTACYGIVGVIGPWGSLITAHFIHDVLSIAVLVVGFITGVYALRKLRKTSSVEILTAYAKLCDECRQGNEPLRCPIPKKFRPTDCPKNS